MKYALTALIATLSIAACTMESADEVDTPPASQTDNSGTSPVAVEPDVPAVPDADAETEPADPATPVAGRIPSDYIGRWDADAAACGRTTNEMRLVVSPEALRFYEGTGSVTAVRSEGDGISVDAVVQAEGTTDRRTYRLSVNTAGNRLTVTTPLSSTVRVRCPA